MVRGLHCSWHPTTVTHINTTPLSEELKKMKKAIIAGLTTAFLSSVASAAVKPFDTEVVRTMISENFGECMFKPSVGPRSQGLSCNDNWVTADCAGLLGGSKSLGKSKFDTILLAELTGSTIRVRVDDSKTINGFCFVEQVQTVPAS